MFNIAVIDNDNNILCEMESFIYQWSKAAGENISLSLFNSSENLMLTNAMIDIAFVDIEMPGVDGLHLCEELKQRNPDVILLIITSYMKYLDDAMRVEIFRYIDKPLKYERIMRNLQEAVERHRRISKTVAIRYYNEVVIIKTRDILYIENKKNGAQVVTKNGVYKSSTSPREWENLIGLPDCFVYCHKSFLVNLQNVIAINNKSATLRINDSRTMKVDISQRKYSAFRQAFFHFLGTVQK